MLHLVQSARGPGHARGHRGLRRHPRHQRGRRQRRRDVLHDVQAPPGRRLPRRRLHQHALRGDGRRRDLRAAQGPPRRRQRRDHRGRRDHARAHRVQRGLRLRAGDDGQLGVHGQHDPRVGHRSSSTTCARAPRSLDPRPAHRHLARGRAGARRLPRRPRRRGPGRRSRVAGRPRHRPRERLDGARADGASGPRQRHAATGRCRRAGRDLAAETRGQAVRDQARRGDADGRD